MGRWHAHAASRLGAEIVAIVDVSSDAGNELAARFGAGAVYANLDGALAEAGIDVVHICSPIESHASLIDVTLTHGCHALVEKPLVSSLAETEAVLRRAHERGLLLSPVHQLPFQPGFRSLLERREQFGELVRVDYRTCSAGGTGRSADGRRRVLREIVPHPVSLLYHLFGDSVAHAELEIASFTADDLEITGHIAGVRVAISISLRGRPTRNELEIIGTRASGFADLFHGYAIVETGRVSRPAKIARPFRRGGQLIARASLNLASRTLRREPAYPGLRELIGRFYAAALGGGSAPITTSETLAAARVMERVRSESR